MTQNKITTIKKNPKAFLNVRLFLDDGLRVILYIHFPSFRCCQHICFDIFFFFLVFRELIKKTKQRKKKLNLKIIINKVIYEHKQ